MTTLSIIEQIRASQRAAQVPVPVTREEMPAAASRGRKAPSNADILSAIQTLRGDLLQAQDARPQLPPIEVESSFDSLLERVEALEKMSDGALRLRLDALDVRIGLIAERLDSLEKWPALGQSEALDRRLHLIEEHLARMIT